MYSTTVSSRRRRQTPPMRPHCPHCPRQRLLACRRSRTITVRPPGRRVNRSDEPIDDEDANDGSDEDANSPASPIHDVSYVPSYPSKSTGSVLIRNGRGGGNRAMLDEAMHLPIAFSAGLPGGIRLSQLPNPCSTRDATVSPDADGWKGARRWRTSSCTTSMN